jgi:hypothetical protein
MAVGLYSPVSGERLPLAKESGDSIIIDLEVAVPP